MKKTIPELQAENARFRKALEAIRDYPGKRRADSDGYPAEIAYDEFAYKRIVDAYRKAARNALKGRKPA